MTLQKTARLLGVILFLSLAGNLLLGGVLAGHLYGASSDPIARRDCGDWQRRNVQLQEKLPPADYQTLKTFMAGHTDEFRAARAKMDEAHDVVEAAQHADPFDQEALDRALQNEKDLKRTVLGNIRATSDQILPQLSPEGQRIFRQVSRKGRPDANKSPAHRGALRDNAHKNTHDTAQQTGSENSDAAAAQDLPDIPPIDGEMEPPGPPQHRSAP